MLLAALVVPLLEAGNGVKVGPPAVIAHGDAPVGAVDRAGALAIWRDRGCIEVARLAGDATAGKPVQLGCGASGAPRAASSGEVTLVVWPAGGELAGALVTPELRVTPIHVRGENPIAVTAAFDGTRFLATTTSCTAADLLVLDRAGTVGARTVLKTLKPHDTAAIAGAAVACEGRACEVAYAIANNEMGIGCENEIRKPRWGILSSAPLTAGTPGAFTLLDTTTFDTPTFPAKAMITHHGLAWAYGGFNTRRDSAKNAFGSLTATTTYHSELWNGRETVTPDHVELEFQAAAPEAAHHVPLVVPDETSPDVLALGGDRFVLLTAAREGIVARAIAIEPAYFTHPPQGRAPVLTGSLRTSSGKLPATARVWCLLRRGSCGEAAVHDDGTFVLPVEDPLDFRVAAQTDDAPVIAYAGDEYWFTPALHETRGAIQLVAAAHITGTVAWPGGKLPKATPLPVEREEYGPHRGEVRGPPEDPLQLTFEAHGVLPLIAPTAMAAINSMYGYPLRKDGTFDVPVIASGRALIEARTRNQEYGGSAWVTTQPGKATRIELPMKKTSTLIIRLKGHHMALGDDMRLAMNTFGCMDDGVIGCTFEHVSPGPQLVSFTTPDWTMLRAIDVPPGERKIVDLPFVPDLAPGEAGVHVARAIDGITVTAVAPGGPAAGLLAPDDVITAIDGVAAGTDLAAAIAKLRGAPDSRVEVTITRARRSQKLTLTRSHGASLP